MVKEQIEGIKQVGAIMPEIIGLGSCACFCKYTLAWLEGQGKNRFHFVILSQPFPHLATKASDFLIFYRL